MKSPKAEVQSRSEPTKKKRITKAEVEENLQKKESPKPKFETTPYKKRKRNPRSEIEVETTPYKNNNPKSKAEDEDLQKKIEVES